MMQCLSLRKRVVSHEFSPGNFQDIEIYIPCGKCINCRINKKREWTQRLIHESSTSESCYFITLTYEEKNVPLDENGNPCVSKSDIQLFMRRLRRRYPDAKIRFFIGSEYGETYGRPHYHGFLFNVPTSILNHSKDWRPGMPDKKRGKIGFSFINRELNDIWQLGFTTIGAYNRQRAGYCANYFVDKQNVPELIKPNFNLMSRKPGIGHDYCKSIENKVRAFNLHACLTDKGNYIAMPRYYSKKLFSNDERFIEMANHSDEIMQRIESSDSFNNPESAERIALSFHNFSKHKKQL